VKFPNHLKYTKDHEWAKIDGQKISIGITDHAQSALGDIVYIDLPQVGRVLKKGETFGVVESIKAVSDLYAPISGKVIEVQSALVQDPAVINRAPHESWMIVIEANNSAEVSELLSSEDYGKFVETL
jgi:glycine cleavage system H protein